MVNSGFNIEKNLKEIENNEYLRKTGFKELINTSVLIIFKILAKSDPKFNPYKNQKLLLNYEMSDFSSEISTIESVSGIKVELYKKALILVALRRLKESSYIYTYNNEDFQLKLSFNFNRTSSNTYPVEVKISYKNLADTDEKINLLTDDFINTLFNQIVVPKEILQEKNNSKGKHIQSGHYTDMKLQHRYDELKKGLEPNFYFNSQQLAKIIKDEKIVMGIRLSVPEDRVLNSILKLLHDKSDRTAGSKSYFRGNMEPEKRPYGGEIVDFPVLSFRPSELYKEYIGKNDYSGAEARQVKETLENLSTKNFLVVYKRHKFDEKGTELIDRIEEYQPLLKIIKYYENITVEEDRNLDKGINTIEDKENVVVCLNHIFIDQINTKFIEYPNDINERTVIASGGVRKVTESNIKIRDYFLREISNGHETCEINEDKLPYILGLEKYVKAGKKKRTMSKIEDSIKFALDLKIINQCETIIGVSGQFKYRFYLNKSF